MIKVDEASIVYGIRELIHHGYPGYIGVEADAYDGSHRDTFVVAIEIADVMYSITPQFNQNWRGQFLEGKCQGTFIEKT